MRASRKSRPQPPLKMRTRHRPQVRRMNSLYVIAIGDDEMVGTARASGPAEAVDAYYDGLDAYCTPNSELSIDFPVNVLRVPEALAAQAAALVDDEADSSAIAKIDDLVAGHPGCFWQVVSVSYRNGERISRVGA